MLNALRTELTTLKIPTKRITVSSYPLTNVTPIWLTAEFALSKKEYFKNTGRTQENDIIAYQVRQSFKPGEVTPEEANAIGYEFAKRFTKGNHAFIVCTHIDKAHIHNHIIWNSTALDCTRKFRDFWGKDKAVRMLSDLICYKHKLSVIINPKPHGKSYNSWLGDNGRKSNRDYLKEAIDRAFEKNPKSYDEFFALLREDGYTVIKGKHLTFSHPRQKKNIRVRSLGEGYSERDIQAAILGNKANAPKSRKRRYEKTNLLSDIEKMINSGKGAAYENWAKKFSAKQIAKSIIFLKEHSFANYDEFAESVKDKQTRYGELSASIKSAEKRLSEIAVLKKHIINYSKTRDIYVGYRNSGYSKKYLAEHEADIVIHKAAKKAFDELKLDKLPTIKKLNSEYAELLSEKKANYAEYVRLQKEVREMLLHKQNYEYILGIEPDRNEKNERTPDIENSPFGAWLKDENLCSWGLGRTAPTSKIEIPHGAGFLF